MSVADRAVFLGQHGLSVFPCRSNKSPAIAGGNGCLDASTDAQDIRELWNLAPAPLIGVATGQPSGFDVIDIDPRHDGEVWEQANMEWLKNARIHQTHSGGRHYIFAHTAGLRNSAGKIASGVDIRADGGYIIWWPEAGCSVLNDVNPPPLPLRGLMKIRPKEPEPVVRNFWTTETTRRLECGSAYGLEALAQECRNIRASIDGGKHQALNKAAYSIGGLVAANELDEGAAFSELRGALNDIRLCCKDFRSAERTLEKAFQQGMDRPRHVESMEPVDDGKDWAPILQNLERPIDPQPEIPPALPPTEKGSVPSGIWRLDGFLQEFVDYTMRTAVRPQPFAALAAGIALVGALAGRRYQTASQRPAWSNFYVATLIDSGGGKEHARTVIKRLLHDAQLMDYLGGENIASGTGLHTAMSRHPSRLFMIDEAGDFLRGVLGSKASGHKQEIAQKLKTLYTSASDIVLGTEYADQSDKGRKRVDLCNPVCCIYGTSTPQQWWDAVAGASLADGLMGRFLLFVPEENYPDANELATNERVPLTLIDKAQAIAAGIVSKDTKNIANQMLSDVMADPHSVPLGLPALKALKAVQNEQDALLKANEGTYKTSLVARLVENTLKLALVKAVSRDPAKPFIGDKDIEWGQLLATHCFETMLAGAERYASDSDAEARTKLVLETIRRLGKDITTRQITRALRMKITNKEKEEALSTLVEGGWVIRKEIPPQGQKRIVTYTYSVA